MQKRERPSVVVVARSLNPTSAQLPEGGSSRLRASTLAKISERDALWLERGRGRSCERESPPRSVSTTTTKEKVSQYERRGEDEE